MARLRSSLLGVAAVAMLGLTPAVAVAATAGASVVVPAPAAVTPAAFATDLASSLRATQVSFAVDGAGHLYVAAKVPHGIEFLTDRSGPWVGSLVLSNGVVPSAAATTPGSASRGAAVPAATDPRKVWGHPSITLDDNGRVFIAADIGCFDCAPGDSFGIWYVTDKGHAAGVFGAPVKLAGRSATDPSLKVTGGHIYLAYANIGLPGPVHAPVWFTTNAGGSWTRVKIATDGYGPSMRIDGAGHARIAFNAEGRIGYARATTSTGGFVTVTVPGTTGRADGNPSLALDTAGRPQIAWNGGSGTWWVRQTAGGWSALEKVAPWVSAVSLSVDAHDVPHIAYGGTNLTHAWRTGGTWHKEPIAAGVDAYVGDAQIRATPTGTYVVYAATKGVRGVYAAKE